MDKTSASTRTVLVRKGASFGTGTDAKSLADWLGVPLRSLWYGYTQRAHLYNSPRIFYPNRPPRTVLVPAAAMRVLVRRLRERVLAPLCKMLGPHVCDVPGRGQLFAVRQHVHPCPVCESLDRPHTCRHEFVADDEGGYRIEHLGSEACEACRTPTKHDCPRQGVKVRLVLAGDLLKLTRHSMVRSYFGEALGCSEEVSRIIATLLTVPQKHRAKTRNMLPGGSAASKLIANLVADWRLDRHILAALPDWRYTRIGGVLFLSHPQNLPREAVDAAVERICSLAKAARLEILQSRVHVQRFPRRQSIHGVVINRKLNVPRGDFRALRSLIHNVFAHGFEAEAGRARQPDGKALCAHIEGKLAHLSNLAPGRIAPLRLIFDQAKAKHAAGLPRCSASPSPPRCVADAPNGAKPRN